MNLYINCQWATNLRKDMIKQAGWIKVVIISPPPLGKMCDPSFELEFGLVVLEMPSMY